MGTKRRGVLAAAFAAAVGLGGVWFTLSGDAHQAVAKAPPPAAPVPSPAPEVQVIEAITRTVPEVRAYTGRLAAVEHVDLRPRLGGYVAKVRFREGSLVERGQVLFELDARPLRAAVARARAQLRQAEERQVLAGRKATRARSLRADDVISQAELDVASADQAETAAAVAAARAWLETARIDLDDTRVRAPIDGRVGEALVTVGNLVGGGSAGATLLTTIVSVDPLHVEFDLDEATFRRLTAGPSGRQTSAGVQVRLGDEAGPGRAARLDFLGTFVDPSSGTARARAVLPNPDGLLSPGMFARVRLETGAARPVVLIRDEAVGTAAQGRHVLVVKPDGVVEARSIELGEIVDELRVVRSGLAAGERVILKGLARPGMTVTPKLQPTTGGAP